MGTATLGTLLYQRAVSSQAQQCSCNTHFLHGPSSIPHQQLRSVAGRDTSILHTIPTPCSKAGDPSPPPLDAHIPTHGSSSARCGVRGQPAPGAGAEMHAATTWWHQLKLSEQELINTSCSPWLGNCSAVFSISVVRRVVVKHQVMFYSCRVNGCGLESRSRGWV